MAELVLGAFLPVIVEKLASAGISQFLKLTKGKKIEAETIQKWEHTLRMIAALLTDAEHEHRRQTDKGAFLKKWFEDLEDLAYDLEDILDEFATEAQLFMLQKEAKEEDDHDVHDAVITGFFDSAKHKVKSFLACGSTAGQQFQYSKGDIPSRIRDISIRLECIHTQAIDFGLIANSIMQQETHRTQASNASWRQSTSLVCEKTMYGRDDKRNEIIEKLLKDEPSYENVVVIPIVGMGGVGKTTLAQYVYNDEQQLKGHFDLKAWVCVSDVFDVTRITTEILNSFTNGKHSFSSLNQAQENLLEVLKGKKFLIILDDIWSEEYSDWSRLQTPFKHGLKGSRVIVTTRKDIIAKMVISNPTQNTTIYLKGLSDDDCWCIFQQHINDDPDLDEMRDDIVKKCAGLPLAAKALGGLLKSIVDKRQRRSILESSIWSEKSDILPVLLLSYHNLSSNLKRSFAYCSVLPKDYEFDEMEVVLLWMAQGFIPEDNSEKMEDVGHDYFFDLVSRSLFEECSPSDYYGETLRKFIMHDLIHDLAQWAAGDMCCVMGAMNTQTIPKRTRHIYLTENDVDEMLGNKLLNPPQLRTLLLPVMEYCFPVNLKIEILECVQRFTNIRTLRLCSTKIEVLPEFIGNMIHLRYLLLQLLKVRVLPKSISKLCNLQTLDLRGCYYLQKVPDVRFLKKLRHLHIKGTSLQEMPLGMGRLKSLQTLDSFVLTAGCGSRIQELSNFLQLNGSLSISGLQNVTNVGDARDAQLHEKQGIVELLLEWGYIEDNVDDNTKIQVLEHLNPHTSIEECFLRSYRGSTFPTWLGDSSFSLMVNIELMDCKKCESLPPLGQLPSLKNLKVEGMDGIKHVGLEFYGSLGCSISFPALETLSFHNLKSWVKWVHLPVENNKAFPCLKKLSITRCKSLQDDLLPNLPSLKELLIESCPSTTAISQIPLTIQSLEINKCEKLRAVQFIELASSSCNDKEIEEKRVVAGAENVGSLEDTVKPHGLSAKVGSQLPHLTKVRIKKCPNLILLLEGFLYPALKELEFKDCNNMEGLPSQMHKCTNLRTLSIQKCPRIDCFPKGGLPKNLKNLEIEGVNIKQHVQESGLHLLNSLDYLTLANVGRSSDSAECSSSPRSDLHLPSSLSVLLLNFPNLKSISCGSTSPNLTRLRVIDCAKLESLVGYDLTLLTDLSLNSCPAFLHYLLGGPPIISSISRIGDFTLLTYLFIRDMTNIDKLIRDWGLNLLTSLHYLTLHNLGRSTDSVECIPGPELRLPSSLRELDIMGFPNLKSTSCRSSFPKLRMLSIQCCPKFESFGDNGLPSWLREVYIYDCDLIEQHLKTNPVDDIIIGSEYRGRYF
ncbi:putative disease resistance RPP13-like protein 1 [Beta vulgaris subsp. vulgaris]|uniref:putative disease resistance RPP13-like protein 1 n=1 Tax=Beta vulgaris subsp. vulgaris TaxID=3555 RepID=UPI002036B407|nr:putative disease resistance RPP13-like protein 1 [Beta vulgaris subsp. vulgaris]XP_048494125.1 putative disease resistance RPP13-like protein 1 [Beta vulgaris subsp. vulgaris]XP_048494126.1 putative disease resistance RPP13-like protein 1 [Beta vulgaris subsp. vulgaris]XP_048494127.1 putative disease resistance RPP13-like protein 1 [Beta vulgaris subsp. vulgaris]XP_048494128.1 putative disease resistance RPP13-like protein 1 [Beta vulgaris subsp. vulgaris]